MLKKPVKEYTTKYPSDPSLKSYYGDCETCNQCNTCSNGAGNVCGDGLWK